MLYSLCRWCCLLWDGIMWLEKTGSFKETENSPEAIEESIYDLPGSTCGLVLRGAKVERWMEELCKDLAEHRGALVLAAGDRENSSRQQAGCEGASHPRARTSPVGGSWWDYCYQINFLSSLSPSPHLLFFLFFPPPPLPFSLVTGSQGAIIWYCIRGWPWTPDAPTLPPKWDHTHMLPLRAQINFSTSPW